MQKQTRKNASASFQWQALHMQDFWLEMNHLLLFSSWMGFVTCPLVQAGGSICWLLQSHGSKNCTFYKPERENILTYLPATWWLQSQFNLSNILHVVLLTESECMFPKYCLKGEAYPEKFHLHNSVFHLKRCLWFVYAFHHHMNS